MALKHYNPTSPGRRALVLVDRSELHKGKPEKALTEGLTKSGGRGGSGRIAVRFRGGAETGQLARACGPLQRTREDLREGQSSQPLPKPARVAFASRGQGQIGQSRVLAGEAPGGFAVPRQMQRWKDS